MRDHIKIFDFLRGAAALMVVLFHFGTVTLPTIKPNYLNEILIYGEYGVQVFFVISGFIIPYSMARTNYKVSNYFKFIYKRIIRINPPYYLSIVLVFILHYSAILIINRPIEGMYWPGSGIYPLLSNLTFAVPFVDVYWYNPAYWTLAIEFQLYIVIGLILPLLLKKIMVDNFSFS